MINRRAHHQAVDIFCLVCLAFGTQSRAKELLQSQPQAAFVYLVHASRTQELRFSLESLQQHFLEEHGPYPIILFHNEQIPVGDRTSCVPDTVPDVQWVFLHNFTSFPHHYVHQSHATQQRWPTGNYHHMIRFWWLSIFQQPELAHLEYFCRLDTDSKILARVPRDIFATMRDDRFVYGFKVHATDGRQVTDGLWEFVEDFLMTHPDAFRQAEANNFVIPSSYDAPFDIYYNNFEVVDIKAFRDNPSIQEFVEAIDKSNNIYNRRWGDAPLRYALCHMFFDVATQVKEFCELAYEHYAPFPATC